MTPSRRSAASDASDSRREEAERPIEWTDAEGTRAVLNDGRLSVYGRPSLTRDDGWIAIGVDLPESLSLPDPEKDRLRAIEKAAREIAKLLGDIPWRYSTGEAFDALRSALSEPSSSSGESEGQ